MFEEPKNQTSKTSTGIETNRATIAWLRMVGLRTSRPQKKYAECEVCRSRKPEGRKWDAPRARGANLIGLSGFFKPHYLCGICATECRLMITRVRSRVRRMRQPRRLATARHVLSRTWIHATWSGPSIIHAVALVAWLV